jgi:hypothetical protein
MPIYEVSTQGIRELDQTTFGSAGLQERRDLQRLLRENIGVIAPDTLVISEEFGDWQDSKRRIDHLAVDREANLVVIELKRTEDGGHMELQSIRYAAMVSTMTFDQAVDALGKHLKNIGREDDDARSMLLKFLGWGEPSDDKFAQDISIVLASAEFSKELTSCVLWLREHDIDVRCIRLRPYKLETRTLVDVQQIIPLPEAATYQVQIREKSRKERETRTTNIDFTRFDVRIGDEQHKSVWKREGIFLVCRHLCENGFTPEQITALFDWRPGRVWLSLDGNLNGEEFSTRASERALSGGPAFNQRRWYCDDDELVHVAGKTYAFSNQWGGANWHRAMNLLKEKYPAFHIEFTETGPSD